MEKFIVIDGVKYYYQRKTFCPKREDFFVVTGEEKFGGIYHDTGYYNEQAFETAVTAHWKNASKKCENKQGFYCKNEKCNYPKCLSEVKN